MRASSLPSPPSKEGGGQIEIATTITPKPILKLTEKSNRAYKLLRARSSPPSKKPRGLDRDRYDHYAQADIKAN